MCNIKGCVTGRIEKRIGRQDYKLIHQIADKLKPTLKRQFLQALQEMRDSAPYEQVLALVRNDDLAGILSLFSGDNFKARLGAMAASVSTAMGESGRHAAARLGGQLKTNFAFNITNPEAAKFVTAHTAALVKDIDKVTREGLKAIFEDAVTNGLSHQDRARAIRGLVGALPRDVIAGDKVYRSMLNAKVPLREANKKYERFMEKKIKIRAETISRTESIRAASAGQQAAWEQAASKGLIPNNTKRIWIITPDDLLCPICEELEGKTTGLTDSFSSTVKLSPGGAEQSYTPQYPPAHPRCRCTVGLDL